MRIDRKESKETLLWFSAQASKLPKRVKISLIKKLDQESEKGQVSITSNIYIIF